MTTKKYYVGIDLQQNQLQNAVVHNSASAPSSPVEGQIYQNTTDNKLYVYDGTSWIDMSTHTVSNVVVNAVKTTLDAFIADGYNVADFAEGDVLVLSAATDPEERAWINLGTDLGTSADFVALSIAYDETAIKALFGAGTGLDYSDGTFSIANSGVDTAQLADDSVTAAKINADVAGDGLVQDGVDGSLDVNVDDSTIEISGDAVQVKDGGITQSKLDSTLEGKIVTGYAETVGDGSATSFTITHNLGTDDIMTAMYEVASGECVACQVTRDSINQITIGAFPAPATNDLRILVQKIVTA